jgi:hypothetical protein
MERYSIFSGSVRPFLWVASGKQLVRRLRRVVFGFGDGRIPSGILVASMTGVRLSFRRLGVMPVRVHFTPIKHDPKPSSGPLLAHVKMVPPARVERALLAEPHFEWDETTLSICN